MPLPRLLPFLCLLHPSSDRRAVHLEIQVKFSQLNPNVKSPRQSRRPYILKDDLRVVVPPEYIDDVFAMLLPIEDIKVVRERCRMGIERILVERRDILLAVQKSDAMVGSLRCVLRSWDMNRPCRVLDVRDSC